MPVIQAVVSVAAVAAIGAVYWVLYRRAVPRPVALPAKYLTHDPSGLPPAMVGSLFDQRMTPDKLAATLLDLVRRHVVTMTGPMDRSPFPFQASDDSRILRVQRERVDGLRQFEKEFVYELFDHMAGGDEIQLGSLRRWWSAFPATAGVSEGIIVFRIQQDLVAEGLVDPLVDDKRRVLSALALETLAGLLLVFVLGPWALLFVALAVVLAFMSQRVVGLTREGVKVKARYTSFRRYLAEYGRFQHRSADAVVVWEEYLPLAIVLGAAEEAEHELGLGGSPFVGDGPYGRHFPDEVQAVQYLDFRRVHDLDLPQVRFIRSTPPTLRFVNSRGPGAMGPAGPSTTRAGWPARLAAAAPLLVVPVMVAVCAGGMMLISS
jgi:hypothetical protein